MKNDHALASKEDKLIFTFRCYIYSEIWMINSLFCLQLNRKKSDFLDGCGNFPEQGHL